MISTIFLVLRWYFNVKLLVVTNDLQLKFNKHVSSICQKATRQLNALKRIGQYLCKLGRLTTYHSFILSNFTYWFSFWHFCRPTWRKYDKENLKDTGTIFKICHGDFYFWLWYHFTYIQNEIFEGTLSTSICPRIL